MDEFALIERHFRRAPRDPAVRVGIGDDGAVISPTPDADLVLSVDMLVEGRHFFAGADAARLGHKALAVNLSDLAAMGATPRFALLAGALPDADEAWLAAFMAGFRALADEFGVELIGGDTTRGPRNLCVTVVGEVPRGAALTRSGARDGDDIYVSGNLGDAALALAVIERRTTLDAAALSLARERLERPCPRVALGLRLRAVASAALDLSDGLAGDLRHVLERSQVGAIVDLAAVPCSAALAAKCSGPERALALACLLAGGDDYELCFCAPPAARTQIAACAAALALPLTRIGAITAGGGLVVRDEHGSPLPALPRAFDHFAA
ncbi:MAG: thiamine-phosphate kinase [Casimicrobiaceae bacterium]